MREFAIAGLSPMSPSARRMETARVEPITTTVAVSFFGTWAATKLADSFWNRLAGFFRYDHLEKQIASALANDDSFRRFYDSSPSLDKQRLTPERIRALLEKTVTNDINSLAKYLADEQLVDLPLTVKEPPPSFDVIWLSVARAIAAAVAIAIIKDEELVRLFQLGAAQLDFAGQQAIVTEVQSLRAQLESLAKQIADFSPSTNGSVTIDSMPTEVLSEGAAVRSINLLSGQMEDLEEQLREQLDANTERLWDLILSEIQRHNFRAAIAKGTELAEWLESRGDAISPSIRGRAFLLLAQVALIESSELGTARDNFGKARRLLGTARAHVGLSIADDNVVRLLNFEAKLLAIDGKNDDALALLGDRDDNHSLTTRLLILIDANRFDKAGDLIRATPLDAKWCDYAVMVFARLSDVEEANRILQWGCQQGSEQVDHRSRVAFVRGTLMRLSAAHSDSAFSAIAIAPQEAGEIREALSILRPIVDVCKAKAHADNGLEAEAIGFAYSCCRLLGSLDEAASFANVLQHFRPVSLDYLVGVLRDDVEPFDGLVAATRDDYPHHFEARYLALALEIRGGLEGTGILEGALSLEPLADDARDCDRLARIAVQAAIGGSAVLRDRARAFVSRIVGQDHFLVQLIEVDRLFGNAQLDECESLLNSFVSVNDTLVEQFRAQLLIKRKRFGDAAQVLEAIARRMSEPELLKDAARLALDARPRRLDIAINALTDAVALCPNDAEANRMLAFVYVQLKGFAHAAKCFRRLHRVEPDEPAHELNLAQCLALANRPDESLSVLDRLCAGSPPGLRPHTVRADLLQKLGRPQKAFASLHEIRDDFWSAPEYVAVYMSIAHAANQERRAHEAFEQLWSLIGEGKAPKDVLQPKTFDDLVEFGKQARERGRLLQDQLLNGRLPWLFVERLLNNVPYWGWRVRTQPLSWLLDIPQQRASFAVYSTNSYAVLRADDGHAVTRIIAPERGQQVVIDLSALITLHRLEILPHALEYFGYVKIPPSYLSEVLRHSGQLQPHQLSQKHVFEQIQEAIDRGSLVVGTPLDGSGAKRVDEYSDESEAACHIRDVLGVMDRVGRISRQQLQDAMRVAHKPMTERATGRSLDSNDAVVVALLTLETITERGLLPAFCDTFSQVFLIPEEKARLDAALRGFAKAAETHVWHEDLWKYLSNDPRVDASTLLLHAVENDLDEKDIAEQAEAEEVTVIDAALLAQQEKLPLMVDDRFCQNSVLMANGASSGAAFGTDCLLPRLRDAGLIDELTTARCFLRLMNWRYRFLLLSESLLHVIAEHCAPFDLRQVARYVHDCMRDPGLFSGPEPTTPPIPLAFRYYQDWLDVIANFVANVWLDEATPIDRATELTRWAMSELVPTVPRGLGASIGRVADFSAFTVLHFAMLRLCQSANYSRANIGLRSIAAGLGLSNDSFVRIAADAINSHDAQRRQ